ncbi:MAG TPA: hypothetical protein VFU36_07195 [Jatrophihabitans sp.]|nr:hypothetical protein [Jatrophihabitans sp.]
MTTPALPVLVERWKRYGHDRAYVKIDGRQVGYRNLQDGEVHCERAEHREVIVRATAHLMAPGYLPRHAAPAVVRPATQVPAAGPTDQPPVQVALPLPVALRRPSARAWEGDRPEGGCLRPRDRGAE